MTIFLESPIPVIVLGVLAEAMLAWMFLSTRRDVLLWAMLGVLGLVGVGILVERVVVTENERIEAALDGAVNALKRNDMEALKRLFSRSALKTSPRLNFYLGYASRLQFEDVKISNVEIEINKLASPLRAEVSLYGVARFGDSQGELLYPGYANWFLVEMVKEADGWKIDEVDQKRRDDTSLP